MLHFEADQQRFRLGELLQARLALGPNIDEAFNDEPLAHANTEKNATFATRLLPYEEMKRFVDLNIVQRFVNGGVNSSSLSWSE